MLNDLRFAFRLLLKSPGFSIIAILTLAFGIGVNTAVFSLVHALLFQAPAYARPAQIVQLFSQDVKNPKIFRAFSYPTYRDIREQNTVFDGVLAHNLAMIGVGEKGDSRRAFTDLVSANYFSVLGVAPASGRAFLPEEETPGNSARVAIVSYGYWQKRGRDPGLLGSPILINGRPFTIVGIMPEGFTGTTAIFSPEVWLPLGVYDQVANNFQAETQYSLGDRAGQQLLILGRLKPGVTAAAAGPALKGLAANLEKAFPVQQKDQTFTTAPLSRLATGPSPKNVFDGQVSMLGTLLLSMAAVVLLVACLNLANMLLARGTARRKEIALRLALGARRSRIVRQLLTEGIVLALSGGVFGLLLALWSSDLLIASLGAMLPIDLVWLSGPNPAVLTATFVFCVLGTLCFGLGPALKLSRSGAIADLKEHAGDNRVRRHWKFLPRNPLVVAQIAFSLALLTAAALFIRGAIKAASVDTGLQSDRSFLLEVDAGLSGYGRSQTPELYRALHERLAALPGVERASISATIPFGIISLSKTVRRDGPQSVVDARPATASEGLGFDATWNSVGEDYFATVGLPLLRGRAFTGAEATQPGGPAVAIIDDVLAKKLWPDGNALGQRIQFASSDAERAKEKDATAKENGNGDIKPGESIEIVGIVPATRHDLFESDPTGAIYLPFARGFQSNVFFIIKFNTLSAGTELATADVLRRTVRSVDPALAVLSLKTFAQHLESNVDLWLVRAGAALFSIFGCLALGLSVVGVYGVKAYAVARRTREIGIRMALGARPGTVQWMFLREESLMLGVGLVIGLLLAVGTGKVVSGLLYQVGALDPIAFTIAPVLLAAAALLATWLPARRAARVDPMVALRAE